MLSANATLEHGYERWHRAVLRPPPGAASMPCGGLVDVPRVVSCPRTVGPLYFELSFIHHLSYKAYISREFSHENEN